MKQLERFHETISTYHRYGWQVQRVLMRPETIGQLPRVADSPPVFEEVPVRESAVDAVWFARPSHEGRTAWELRLVSDAAYALFEVFEPDEVEEDREDVRREMEARLIEREAGMPLK